MAMFRNGLKGPDPQRLGGSRVLFDFAKTFNSKTARKRRYNKICELVGLRPDHEVLDVGCGTGRSFEDFNRANEIVGLDLDPRQKVFQDNFRFVHGDAAFMSGFRNREFDVVVSIGVLERVIPYQNLKRATKEIQRVGRAYIVVVPHILTLIDPHSQLPLGQFSPRNFKRFARRWDLIGSGDGKSAEVIEGETLFYLRAREWQSLFPESTTLSYSHLPMGLIRDLIIFRRE